MCLNVNYIIGGIFLTMTKNGMFYVAFGASLFSAASTLILIPIRNHSTGQRMSAKSTLNEVAMSGTMGKVITMLQ